MIYKYHDLFLTRGSKRQQQKSNDGQGMTCEEGHKE